MRGTFDFDPDACDYGPATASIRTILREWMAIDWFAPTAARDDDGLTLFREHNRIARERDPVMFHEHVGVGVHAGGWNELDAWCARVRDHDSPGPDWKFNVLKPLSREHAIERDFELDRDGRLMARFPPQPGDLFVAGDASFGVWWNVQLPKLDIGEQATFYAGYAHHDMLDAILWQLAERGDSLRGNPFWPLVRLYRAGFYPFYLSRDRVVLFRFC